MHPPFTHLHIASRILELERERDQKNKQQTTQPKQQITKQSNTQQTESERETRTKQCNENPDLALEGYEASATKYVETTSHQTRVSPKTRIKRETRVLF